MARRKAAQQGATRTETVTAIAVNLVRMLGLCANSLSFGQAGHHYSDREGFDELLAPELSELRESDCRASTS